jgi:3-hydroxyisobutyrate dehydrogenase-like beta-hydroxyacid dehydrogenase
MALKTVAILSPGDMGHTVGRVLSEHGLRVVACLKGRSERTRMLAQSANIDDVPTYKDLVTEADVALSILVPEQAKAAAQAIAEAMNDAGARPLYVDCNAIAPQTVCEIAEIIAAAGGRFVDASIIGPPPRRPGSTRFYASGPDVAAFAELGHFGLDVRPLGDEVGQASALKMCYAALTKGLTALCTELLTAAALMGVSEPLKAEFQLSQSALYERMEKGLPTTPPKARRWVGEMEEIAATFAHVGLTPKIFEGAADVYRLVSETPLADLAPEDSQAFLALEKMISILADTVKSITPVRSLEF